MGRGSSGAGKGGGKVMNTNKDAIDYFTSPPPPGGSYGDWSDKLTAAEDNWIYEYTGVSYRTINERLRNGHTNGIEQAVACMDDGIAKFELKDDIKVYRGVSSSALKDLFGNRYISADEINKNFKGATVRDKAYLSTATNPGASFGGRVRFEITVRKGKGKGAFVAPMSKHKSESEFLLKRSTPLKIKGARRTGEPPFDTLIIECEC